MIKSITRCVKTVIIIKTVKNASNQRRDNENNR